MGGGGAWIPFPFPWLRHCLHVSIYYDFLKLCFKLRAFFVNIYEIAHYKSEHQGRIKRGLRTKFNIFGVPWI